MRTDLNQTPCTMQPGSVQYDCCHAAMAARILELETTLRRVRLELAACAARLASHSPETLPPSPEI